MFQTKRHQEEVLLLKGPALITITKYDDLCDYLFNVCLPPLIIKLREAETACVPFIIMPVCGTVPGTQQVLKKCLWNE